LFFFFFLYATVSHRPLHSFPTRRSSDLFVARRSTTFARRAGGAVHAVIRRSKPACVSCFVVSTVTRDTADACISRRVASYRGHEDRKSTRLNSSHLGISYAVFCLKKKNY